MLLAACCAVGTWARTCDVLHLRVRPSQTFTNVIATVFACMPRALNPRRFTLQCVPRTPKEGGMASASPPEALPAVMPRDKSGVLGFLVAMRSGR